MQRQTAELHLKPLPTAICQILSPTRMLPLRSMKASSYLAETSSSTLKRQTRERKAGCELSIMGLPDGAAAGVAVAVQRGTARLDMVGHELQILLQTIDDGATAGVDAEMLEG